MASPDLHSFPQPESNDADTVGAALDAMHRAHDETSATDACDALLWAVGNNQTGTFFPVVLGVLPRLQQVLDQSGVWAQRAALEALIDLGGTFVPQPGHEVYSGASVQDTLQAFIHTLRPRIASLAQVHDVRATSAAELLELIDDQVI